MISITNGTQSESLYPATVAGKYETEVLALASGEYTIRVYGLTPTYFDCVVPDAFVETGGNYDSEKMFAWLLGEMVDLVSTGSGTSGESTSLYADFIQIPEGTEKYECNLHSNFTIEELNDDSTNYYLRFHSVDSDYFDFTVAKSNEAVQYGIDPKKLLMWLLKKLKEALCPECS